MSYDIHLEYPPCKHCGSPGHSTGFDANMTSNVSGIWCRALCLETGDDYDADTSALRWSAGLGGFFPIERLPGSLAAEICLRAAVELTANSEKYRQWQPDNGWGTVESARDFLRELGEAWKEHPRAVLRVSR